MTVVMRRADNKRLRTAVYHMSRVAMVRDVLVAMLKSRTVYQPHIPTITSERPATACES